MISDDSREMFPRLRLHASLNRPSTVKTFADWGWKAWSEASLLAQSTWVGPCAWGCHAIPLPDSSREQLLVQIAAAESLVQKEPGLWWG